MLRFPLVFTIIWPGAVEAPRFCLLWLLREEAEEWSCACRRERFAGGLTKMRPKVPASSSLVDAVKRYPMGTLNAGPTDTGLQAAGAQNCRGQANLPEQLIRQGKTMV